MSTYLPGIQDYIPQIQPFQPNLNFYGNVLSQKQSQYDANHKALSGLYGTLLNSPMLRDDNIQRRDEFFTAIDRDIKKISGLDLSLQQNVSAAQKVFTPLTTDKYIAKDMVFTRQLGNEMQRAENFRTCIDPEKCGGQYWDGGVRALNYKAEEFKLSGSDESLNMSAPKFVAHQDVFGKAFKAAKEMGFNVTRVGKQGGFIVTQKNGAALEAPLQDYFLNKFGQDQQMQDMYKTQAYLERKDFAKANAHLYGGEDGAESYYLNTQMQEMERHTKTQLDAVNNQKKVLGSKKAILADKIDQSGGLPEDDPLVKAYLALQDGQAQTDGTAAYHGETLNYLSKNGMLGMNKDAIRFKVDGAVANARLFGDLSRAAHDYSELNSEESMVADPFALNEQENRLAMKRDAKNFEYDLYKMSAKEESDYKMAIAKGEIANPKDRQGAYGESANQSGSSTGSNVYDEYNEFTKAETQATQKFAKGMTDYLGQIFNFYKQNIENNPGTAKVYQDQFKQVFGVAYDGQSGYGELNSKKNLGLVYADAQLVSAANGKGQLMTEQFLAELEPYRKSVKDAGKLVQSFDKLGKENDAGIRDYMQSKLTGAGKAMWGMYFNPDGTRATFDQFRSRKLDVTSPYAPEARYGLSGDDVDAIQKMDPHEAYDKMKKLYESTYKAGYNKGQGKLDANDVALTKLLGSGYTDVPVVKGWRTHPGIAGQVEGLSARNMTGRFDAADKNDPMYKDVLQLVDAASNGNPIFTSGVLGTAPDAVAGLNPAAKAIFDAYSNDMRNTYKMSDENRPKGTFEFAGVAANNPNMVGVTFFIPESWAKQHAGTKDNPGITRDKSVYANGITMYINRDKVAGNPFFDKLLNQSDMRTILNINGSYDIDQYRNKGGVMTVKKLEDGFALSGRLVGIQDGREVVVPLQFNLPESADPATFIPEYESKFKEVQKMNFANLSWLKGQKGGPVKSTQQLDAMIQGGQSQPAQ